MSKVTEATIGEISHLLVNEYIVVEPIPWVSNTQEHSVPMFIVKLANICEKGKLGKSHQRNVHDFIAKAIWKRLCDKFWTPCMKQILLSLIFHTQLRVDSSVAWPRNWFRF